MGTLLAVVLASVRVAAFLWVGLPFRKSVPPFLLALLSVGIAVSLVGGLGPVPEPPGLGALAVATAAEVLLGVVLGMLVSAVFNAATLAGEAIAQGLGQGLQVVLDPVTEHSVTPFSVLISMLVAGVSVNNGVHTRTLVAIADGFAMIPPGAAVRADWTLARQALVHSAWSSFDVGIQVAVPVMAVGLSINAATAVLGRLAPRMNAFFAAGPAIGALFGTAAAAAALPWVVLVLDAFDAQGLAVVARLAGAP